MNCVKVFNFHILTDNDSKKAGTHTNTLMVWKLGNNNNYSNNNFLAILGAIQGTKEHLTQTEADRQKEMTTDSSSDVCQGEESEQRPQAVMSS